MVVVAGPPGRQHVVADATPVELELVHAERGRVQTRTRHRRGDLERAPEVRTRLRRLEILVPRPVRRTSPASPRRGAVPPRPARDRSTPTSNRRRPARAPGPCAAPATPVPAPATERAPTRRIPPSRSSTRARRRAATRTSYCACSHPGVSVTVCHERRGVGVPTASELGLMLDGEAVRRAGRSWAGA